MDLVTKIFETLEIGQLSIAMMGLVIVLTLVLSRFLIHPVLDTIEERGKMSAGQLEESKSLMTEVENRARTYDESLRKAAADALAAKRKKMEEAGREERNKIEAVASECALEIESVRERVASEKEAASVVLRSEVSRLSVEIAGKVLGRGAA